MHIPFDQLSDDARIWIYQSDRSFTSSDTNKIKVELTAFCQQWSAHQFPLRTSFQIAYERFVILAVDESYHSASGCSIDSSVAIIRKLEQELAINFFNRTEIAYLENEKLQVKNLPDFKKEISSGQVNPTIEIFNNLIATKGKLESQWLVALDKSWLARNLPSEKLV